MSNYGGQGLFRVRTFMVCSGEHRNDIGFPLSFWEPDFQSGKINSSYIACKNKKIKWTNFKFLNPAVGWNFCVQLITEVTEYTSTEHTVS